MHTAAHAPTTRRGVPPCPPPLATATTGRQGTDAHGTYLVRCLGLLLALLLSAATLATAADFGLQLRDAGDARGAVVSAVAEGSSAATAGVEPGDIVLRLGQTSINSTSG